MSRRLFVRLLPVAGAVLALALVSGLLPSGAAAQPTPPNRFFGAVTLDGRPAPLGATVTASVGGMVCGTSTVTVPGSYLVDVASAATRTGCGTDGATVIFHVNGISTLQTAVFRTGAITALNLTAFTAFSFGPGLCGVTKCLPSPPAPCKIGPCEPPPPPPAK